MRSVFGLVALGLLVGMGVVPPVDAEICALDDVPAATLLLPYFEVDLADPGGRTTLFSVHNALDRSVLAPVTLWTDHAVPTFAFDVFLTGFDVQGFNLRDLFRGSTPTTGSGVSPLGHLSAPRGSFPGCDEAIEIEVPTQHLIAAPEGARAPRTEIAVGEPLLVRSTAGGCYSWSCSFSTQRHCLLRPAGGNVLEVQSRICLADRLTPCLPVCDYTPTAYCFSDALDAGVYTLRSDDLELTFTVPSTVPEQGLCEGEIVTTP